MEISCLHRDYKNCCPNGKCSDSQCPDTHTCCWEQPPDGNPKLGLCVLKDKSGKKGNCNFKTGLPYTNCYDQQNKMVQKNSVENFLVINKEGYNDNDDDCTKRILPLVIIIVLFVIILTLKYFKNK